VRTGSFQIQIQIHRQRPEEARRHRHQPLMAAPAVGHKHVMLTGAKILETQTKDLAAAQTAQQHGLDYGPIAVLTQRCHQGVHLLGTENPR
jgi:hypothetical protein